ncbi:MAG: SulP family inorganic anion transporter [Nitrospirota bacterium]|nr:SulP family inorganic anion transporter [Nitrospirota bacterium]MDH5700228.1 SulP family inorganic anion transporter [Nitrospirota bacterium]
MGYVPAGIRGYLKDFNFKENLQGLGSHVRGDVLAGVTVAMVVLPMALAFGVASGLGAIAGMWSAVAAGLIAGPLSGSLWSVGGPTGPMTIQILNIAQTHQLPDGSPHLVFIFTTIALAGVILIVLGFLKLGQFIKFTPYSVISGFMTGLGFLYMLLQLNPFLGLPGAKSITSAITELPSTFMHASPSAVGIGLLTLVIVMIWPKISPVTWLPGPLIGLFVGTAAATALGLDIPKIGDVPTGFPELYLPNLDLLQEAFVPAAALAGLCIFDSLLTCLIVDNMTGTHHNSDRELVAQGSANLFSGLVGGLGGATNTMPCVVNIQSGARTRLSSITMGLVLLSFILGLGSLAASIPLSALAGILLKAGYDILDMRVLPVVRRLPTSDLMVFGLVVFMTVFWNLLSAMAMGLAVAFFRFVKDQSDRYKADLNQRDEDVKQEEEDLIFSFARDYARKISQNGANMGEISGRFEHIVRDRIIIVRPHGPLFFGAIDWLNETVEHLDGKDVLIIRCKWLDELDLSGAYALGDLIEAANRRGVAVLTAGMSPRTRQVLADLNELSRLQEDHICAHFNEVLDKAMQIVEKKAVEAKPQAQSEPVLAAQ